MPHEVRFHLKHQRDHGPVVQLTDTKIPVQQFSTQTHKSLSKAHRHTDHCPAVQHTDHCPAVQHTDTQITVQHTDTQITVQHTDTQITVQQFSTQTHRSLSSTQTHRSLSSTQTHRSLSSSSAHRHTDPCPAVGVDRLLAWTIIGADIKHFYDYRYRPFSKQICRLFFFANKHAIYR